MRSTEPNEAAIIRVEQRSKAHAQAAEQWLALLREMEQSGESGSASYERYYQAYLLAKEQQKRAELELINLRQRLAG